MDNSTVIALIVVALIILAVIIRYRHKLALGLRFFGIKLDVEAQDRPDQESQTGAAGVRVQRAKSSEGGLLVEEGRTQGPGVGVEVSDVEVKDDIIIGKGESGSPKADPPA